MLGSSNKELEVFNKSFIHFEIIEAIVQKKIYETFELKVLNSVVLSFFTTDLQIDIDPRLKID